MGGERHQGVVFKAAPAAQEAEVAPVVADTATAGAAAEAVTAAEGGGHQLRRRGRRMQYQIRRKAVPATVEGVDAVSATTGGNGKDRLRPRCGRGIQMRAPGKGKKERRSRGDVSDNGDECDGGEGDGSDRDIR
ncbi:hypothetical protein PF004_g17288 [Phytophthora fragariae]|uniref:Uncharacterized protein n=1 Tax=Phytophthora fragariae TaxID=53985 RepID=A0A6G0NFX0_9STRA|nr:hypothetical protein PF004_g17288 [Phytophthora fragariae]